MWYAQMNNTGKIIAEGATMQEVSDYALSTGVWNRAPGSVAPYILTTIVPDDCSICCVVGGQSGKVSDGYEYWECQHCEGTGYKMNSIKDI